MFSCENKERIFSCTDKKGVFYKKGFPFKINFSKKKKKILILTHMALFGVLLHVASLQSLALE